MPERSKKNHKHGRNLSHTGSRWHNFHFSGKLISCSVIFGFLLILIGGILLAIGMDRDEESKSNDYGDIQKKPPLVFVGPAIMGIGGFTVIVGVIMCLVETKVFRRRGGDANPLINSEGGESLRNSEAINGESDASRIPSDSKHNKRHRHCKKSRKIEKSKRSHSPKSHSSQETSPCSSQSSEPIGISGKGSRNFLSTSDTFLTPPGSFTPDDLQMQGAKRDDVTQTTASLLKSYNSSGTYSIEFQTPSASYIDSPSFPSSQDSNESSAPQSASNITGNLKSKNIENARHEFVTPQNSNSDILEPPKHLKEKHSSVVNRHAFLTPKNSTDLLEDSPFNEEMLEKRMGDDSNHPDVNTKSPDKVTTMNVVADVHEPSKLYTSDMNQVKVEPSTNHSKPQEEIEHSDIKVDVLIDAIDDEVKGNAHSSVHVKNEETGISSENIKSNENMVTDSARSTRENIHEITNLIEENELKDRTDSINAHIPELISGDNFNKNDLTSNKGLDSTIDEKVEKLNKDKVDE